MTQNFDLSKVTNDATYSSVCPGYESSMTDSENGRDLPGPFSYELSPESTSTGILSISTD